MATNNELLKKADQLFIEFDGTYKDEVKVFFYKILRKALPEIGDDAVADILLDRVRYSFLYALTPGQAATLKMYYIPEKHPTYKAMAEKIGVKPGSVKGIIEKGLANLASQKYEFYIPAIKEKRLREARIKKDILIKDLGLSVEARNRLERAGIKWKQLASMTEADIRSIRMIGPKLAREIIKKRAQFLS